MLVETKAPKLQNLCCEKVFSGACVCVCVCVRAQGKSDPCEHGSFCLPAVVCASLDKVCESCVWNGVVIRLVARGNQNGCFQKWL